MVIWLGDYESVLDFLPKVARGIDNRVSNLLYALIDQFDHKMVAEFRELEVVKDPAMIHESIRKFEASKVELMELRLEVEKSENYAFENALHCKRTYHFPADEPKKEKKE